MNLPKARTSDILEMEADSELMVYDLRINKAYNLNETLKTIYKACDEKTSFDELKRRHKFTDDLIHFALDELRANDLLEDYENNHFAGLSRREVVKRVGLASLIALPLVSSIVAPPAARAASGFAARSRTQGQICNNTSECFDSNNGGTCNNINNGTRVCCRSGATGTNAPGTTFNGIFQNCNSCAASYAPEFCCSGISNYTGTCTTQGNGTGSCQYRCG